MYLLFVAFVAFLYLAELYLHWFVIGENYIDGLPDIAYWLIGLFIILTVAAFVFLIIASNSVLGVIVFYIFFESTGKEMIEEIAIFFGF